jgi:hypothetical protein
MVQVVVVVVDGLRFPLLVAQVARVARVLNILLRQVGQRVQAVAVVVAADQIPAELLEEPEPLRETTAAAAAAAVAQLHLAMVVMAHKARLSLFIPLLRLSA